MNEPATDFATSPGPSGTGCAQPPPQEAGGEDADLVVRWLYRDYQNLLALEAVLSARRGDVHWTDDH